MKQRLGIAGALLGDAPILLFDEPLNGLDPEGIHWMRGLFRTLASAGRVVFLSTHLMSELQGTADHLIIIGQGRLLADTSVAIFLARSAEAAGRRVSLEEVPPAHPRAGDRAVMRHADSGLGRVLRAEFTKFRTVRGTTRCLLAAAGFLVLAALFASSGSPGTYAQHNYVDQFRFAHQTLDGDGAITARLRSQRSDHPWAMAGIMVKAGTTSGSPYAAMMVTPGHGVRLQAQFDIDTAGSTSTAPRWLKLARSGDRIIGYESADRKAWTEVGAVTLRDLPATVEVGLFVTSPSITHLVPLRPAISRTVPNTATFDEVLVEGRSARPSTTWRGETVGSQRPEAAEVVPADGELTVTGSGDIIGQADDGTAMPGRRSRILAATAGTIGALKAIVRIRRRRDA